MKISNDLRSASPKFGATFKGSERAGLLTRCAFPDRLGRARCIEAVLAVELAELPRLLPLGLEVELCRRFRHGLGHALACSSSQLVGLSTLEGWGGGDLTATPAGLGARLVANRRLVHGLERVVPGHARVVQVTLLSVGAVAHLGLPATRLLTVIFHN